MKFLILGCGSIGRRHAKNLKSLGVKKIILCDPDRSRLESLGKNIKTNLLYQNYKDAVKSNPDILAAVICTPTAYHIEPAIYFAKNKINLFMEKPLSNNLCKINLLSNLISSNNLIFMMGHALMFESGFIKLKSLLDRKVIGKIFSATYLQGQYLPDWHPYADYRIEYSARRDLGGGALLTLTSHTFYVIEWLFGRIISVDGNIVSKTGPLEINVDDSVFLLMRTKKNVIIHTQNSFLTRIHQHKILIEGEKGRLEYDFVEKKINILLTNKKSKTVHIHEDWNDRFLREMKYFLYCLKHEGIEENLNLNSGIRFLQMIKKLNK